MSTQPNPLDDEELARILETAPDGSEVDLVAGVEAKLTSRTRWRRASWTGAFAAAAAALLLLFWPRPEGDVRIKGTATSAEAWSGVELYRLEPERAPVRLGKDFAARDSLLVAYVNGGERPFSYLALFAVSASGKISWYYPAWLDPKDDPQSISIETTTKPIELKERITHELPPGRVVFHAVFSRQPLKVSELERAVSQARDPLAPLLLSGSSETVQQRYVVEVP